MELIELENIWKECDKKITENTRLNKQILKKILISKPQSRLNRIKLRTYYRLSSPLVFLILILITDFQFHFTVNFYIGAGMFVPVYIITYIWEIKYLLSIRKIDLTDTISNAKRSVIELERYEIKITRIRSILMPFAITGVFLILFQKIPINTESVIMFTAVFSVFVLSTYYTFRYSVYERFKKLKKEIEEIENIENS